MGVKVEWSQDQYYYEELRCGCRVLVEYYYGYSKQGLLYMHISQYWLLEARTDCPHYKSNQFFFGKRDLSKLSLEEYLEIRIFERMGASGLVDIDKPLLMSSKGKCKIKWYVPRDSGLDLGHIEKGPVGKWEVPVEPGILPIAGTLEKLSFDFNIHFKPCEGEPCCVASIQPEVVYDPSDNAKAQPIIKKADKDGLEVYADDTDCHGGMFGLPCTYQCDDVDYNMDPSGVSRGKISLEAFESVGINIAPNPTSGIFTVNLSDELDSVELIITDMLGNIVLQKTQTIESQDYDLSSISTGTYTLSIKEGNTVLGTKMIQIIR